MAVSTLYDVHQLSTAGTIPHYQNSIRPMRASLALKNVFRRPAALKRWTTGSQYQHDLNESIRSESTFRRSSSSDDSSSLGTSELDSRNLGNEGSFECESFVSGPPGSEILLKNASYPTCGGLYKPLLYPGEIRLLRLDPGKYGDRLSGKLYTVELDQREFQWEALSYVWGKTAHRELLQLENGQLHITENLELALHQLRLQNEERILWIDAICINQACPDERSAQIQQMGEIYERATFVVIWLGPDHEGQAAANFATLHAASWNKTAEDAREAHLAIQKILRCEWFTRLWVVQEALMAIRATLYWGDATMNYAEFQSHAHDFNQQGPHNLPMWVGEMKNTEGTRTRTILHVLEWTRGMKCSDDRDRIYAILGLRYSREWSPEAFHVAKSIVPDYKRSVSAIYQDLAVRCIESRLMHKLWLFVSHRHDEELSSSELPSWVPDFSRPALPFTTTRSMVYVTEQKDDLLKPFHIQPELDHEDDTARTLLVAGCVIGIVRSVESQCVGGQSPMESFCNIASFWLNNFKYIKRSDVRLHAMTQGIYLRKTSEAQKRDCLLINVLLACALHTEGDVSKISSIMNSLFDYRAVRAMSQRGSYRCREVMDTLYQSFQSMHPRGAYEDQDTTPKIDVLDAYEHVRSVWDCHRLFNVSEGSFGLGPSAMRRGDIVAIIGGAKHPVVLRPNGKYYYLVGNAHVSGLRDWECEKRDRRMRKRSPLQAFKIR